MKVSLISSSPKVLKESISACVELMFIELLLQDYRLLCLLSFVSSKISGFVNETIQLMNDTDFCTV
jgi:hypothetical protein